MASILDQDFGSESEEGDFNPEPGADSDNEDASGSEQGHHTKKRTKTRDRSDQRRIRKRRPVEDNDEVHEIGQRNQAEHLRPASKQEEDDIKDEEDDQYDLADNDGVHGELNEDEEDDEEDDDEEDAISVRFSGCIW